MRISAFRPAAAIAVAIGLAAATGANAVPVTLLGVGTLSGATDLSVGTSGLLENGIDQGNALGGIGSGLAYAGGNTFLALPDRGPNATVYTGGAGLDNTTSYLSRFQTVTLNLSNVPSGTLPWTVTPTLTGTTLLYSPTGLNYGSTPGLPSGTPALNSTGVNYFTGRSDGFGAGASTNVNNGRLDPEGIRVSNDGKYVYVTDEYGPYVYQFDRSTGERTKTFTLPPAYSAANLSSSGAAEISGNTSGRVANKGMEGLAISPDGSTLIGFEQSPLIQDGGDGGRANRIVKIDIGTGAVKEFVYDNKIGAPLNKTYNSSEILALNDHEFLVLERDGKGLGDGTPAVVKKIFKIDLNGATDISPLNISGEANLLPYAVTKTEFLDLKAALNGAGIADTQIPAKLEGMAFGEDVTFNNVVYHTLVVANDNDFSTIAGPNKFYVFGISAADLPTFQAQSIVPVPAAAVLFPSALGLLGLARRRKLA